MMPMLREHDLNFNVGSTILRFEHEHHLTKFFVFFQVVLSSFPLFLCLFSIFFLVSLSFFLFLSSSSYLVAVKTLVCKSSETERGTN